MKQPAPSPDTTYLAGRLAQRYATDLVAYAGMEWPKSFLTVDNPVSEKLHDAGISFAINGRRYLEHTTDRPQIKEKRYVATHTSSATEETDVFKAMHGLIHSSQFRIQYSPLNASIFNGIEGCAPVYFVYRTDRYPEKVVSIFGLAWAFLSLPKIGCATDHVGHT